MNELLSLLSDPAHLSFEAITGLFEAAIGFTVARVWVRLHDRKHHA